MTQRDWQKDMAFILREKERVQLFKLPTTEEDIAIHWLQEAKERGEREKQLKKALEKIKLLAEQDYIRHQTDQMYLVAKDILDTLYPDTTAPKEGDKQ